MSTFSSDLKIELIGTGEQSGVWGTTTNSNFSNVFEQALVGRVSVPFTDANVTLTATDTVNSQSFRRLYLNCTGANSASRDLIVPTINKTYVVQNNTTGGYDIVIKTSAGTGVTVPNGKAVSVYVDGTNVIQAFDYVPTLGVGTANVTTLNVTTIDTTNLEVTNIKAKDGTASASIADSTGVFTHSTTTVFPAGAVGTPSITTAGDLNTGIFFPAADTIAFAEGGVEVLRLNSSGYALFNSSATLGATDRGAIVSSVTSGANLSLQKPTGGAINFYQGTTITSSIEDISSSGGIGFYTGTAGNVTRFVTINSTGTLNILTTNGLNNSINLNNTTANAFYINSSGNVGLGATPSAWATTDSYRVIEFNGGSSFGHYMAGGLAPTPFIYSNAYVNSSNQAIYINSRPAALYLQNEGIFFWYNASSGTAGQQATFTERMRLNLSGNLGVAVAPSAWRSTSRAIQIGNVGFIEGRTDNNDTVEFGANAFLNSSGAWTYINSSYATLYTQSGAQHIWYYAASGTAGNPITFNEGMRINSSGNVGIGTSSPYGRLDVTSTSAGNNVNLIFASNLSSTANTAVSIVLGAAADPSIRSAVIRGINSGNNAMNLAFLVSNGDVPEERARITSGGYFKASNTGSYNNSTGAYHEFSNDGAAVPTLLVRNTNASFNTEETLIVKANRNTTNNTFYAISYYNDAVSAYRFRVADSGAIATAGGIALGTVTPATSGVGVQFPATQSASSNANTLDDYEEGNWTATITTTGGSVTIGSQDCKYTKIGNFVCLNGIINLSAISSPTGQFTITALPFTPAVASGGGATVYLQNVASTTATSLFAEVGTTPRIYVAKYTELDSLSDAADLLTATTIIKFGAYYVV